MIDHHDDLHLTVEFINRAAVMREELGVAAYRRAMHQALVALGDAVIHEAEKLAGTNARARAPTGTVVPFNRTSRAIRRRGAATDQDTSKPCPRRCRQRHCSRSPGRPNLAVMTVESHLIRGCMS